MQSAAVRNGRRHILQTGKTGFCRQFSLCFDQVGEHDAALVEARVPQRAQADDVGGHLFGVFDLLRVYAECVGKFVRIRIVFERERDGDFIFFCGERFGAGAVDRGDIARIIGGADHLVEVKTARRFGDADTDLFYVLEVLAVRPVESENEHRVIAFFRQSGKVEIEGDGHLRTVPSVIFDGRILAEIGGGAGVIRRVLVENDAVFSLFALGGCKGEVIEQRRSFAVGRDGARFAPLVFIGAVGRGAYAVLGTVFEQRGSGFLRPIAVGVGVLRGALRSICTGDRRHGEAGNERQKAKRFQKFFHGFLLKKNTL